MMTLLPKIQAALDQGQPVRTLELDRRRAGADEALCLITAKRAMFVGNASEDGFENNPLLTRLRNTPPRRTRPVVAILRQDRG